jgi:SAM-dependent MidA family methyltransferase
MTRLNLPQPPIELIQHSNAVCALIQREIAANGGVIGFDRYFELCQYAPGLGYYSAGLHKFGAGGDFVTAPGLGDVFARCVAASLLPSLAAIPEAWIMEVGCGTGAMAADILQALGAQDALPARYLMLERSADLRARQKETLAQRVPQFLARVQWLDEPPTQPWRGIVLGNEIVDALPCQRFEISPDGPVSLSVRSAGQSFEYVLGAPMLEVVESLGSELVAALPIGYRSELQMQLRPWLNSLTETMGQGLVLLFDYGYPRREFYLPERTQGTLVCHYQQRMFDAPFWHPGLVDLSASVDFTALAHAGVECGLEFAGYLSQAEFLLHGALPFLLETLAELDESARLAISRQVRTLTLPGEMGDRIHIMAFARNLPEPARAPVLQRFGLRGSL